MRTHSLTYRLARSHTRKDEFDGMIRHGLQLPGSAPAGPTGGGDDSDCGASYRGSDDGDRPDATKRRPATAAAAAARSSFRAAFAGGAAAGDSSSCNESSGGGFSVRASTAAAGGAAGAAGYRSNFRATFSGSGADRGGPLAAKRQEAAAAGRSAVLDRPLKPPGAVPLRTCPHGRTHRRAHTHMG